VLRPSARPNSQTIRFFTRCIQQALIDIGVKPAA